MLGVDWRTLRSFHTPGICGTLFYPIYIYDDVFFLIKKYKWQRFYILLAVYIYACKNIFLMDKKWLNLNKKLKKSTKARGHESRGMMSTNTSLSMHIQKIILHRHFLNRCHFLNTVDKFPNVFIYFNFD